VLVGPGLRLFPASGTYRRLALVDSTMTTTSVMIGIYEPAEPAAWDRPPMVAPGMS
jgi:hypothetical protein